MKNIERFIKNREHYHKRHYGEPDMTLSFKENSEFYICFWEGYLDNILEKPCTNGVCWEGFTRDNQEFMRTYSGHPVEINLDEYITDLLLYKDTDFEKEFGKETQEVYELILDFLYFAKENNLTVLAEYE